MKKLYCVPCSLLFILCFFCSPAYSQWQFIGSPENGSTYKTFAHGDTLLLASEAGIFYSEDYANNWKPIRTPDSLIVFRNIWLEHQSLYIATIKVIKPYAHTYVIYRSEDWGASWKNITQDIDIQNICRDVYISHDSLIWFGRYETLISFDRGDSFIPAGAGQPRIKSTFVLNDSFYLFTVDGLLIRTHDLSAPWDTVYKEPIGLYTSYISPVGTTLWKIEMDWFTDISVISSSVDAGHSWTTIASLPIGTSTATKIIGDPDHLFLVSDYNDQFYYSEDGGSTWQPFNVPETIFASVYHDGLLLMNSAHGVLKSDDNGAVLSKANKGLEASSVFHIQHAWSALWIDDYDDVFKRQDGEDEWVSVDSLYNLRITTDGHFAAFVNGVPSISSDGGNTWASIPSSAFPAGYTIGSSGFRVAGNVFFLNTNKRALYSRDFGITWKIFDTIDEHQWPIRNGFDNDNHLMVIGGYDDLFVSEDGAVWQNINYNLDDFNASTFVSFYYLTPYYFACGDGRYYRLHQDSTQWIELNAPVAGDVFEFSPFSRVCFYTSYGNVLLTPFYQRGVFASRDYGITWENITDGLTDLQTIVLSVIEPDLYLGVDGGVWKRSLSELDVNGISEAKNNLLFSVSPNPAEDVLNITISDHVVSDEALLMLYDSKGSIIKSMNAGAGLNIKMNIRDIPSGFYFLNAQVGNQSGMVKVMKL